jgi:hypothetical protein
MGWLDTTIRDGANRMEVERTACNKLLLDDPVSAWNQGCTGRNTGL